MGLRRARARVLGRSLRRRPRRCADPGYAAGRRELLERHGLGCWAIGNHLVGQAVCDPIDERHQGVLPPEVWGDGDPEGVRTRAAERMKDTARAAAPLGVDVVTGFTGSSIWHLLYSFPPNDCGADRARLRGLRRALGADHRRLRRRGRALRARGPPDRDRLRLRDDAQGARRDRDRREGFGINFDPSHFEPQFLDPAAFVDRVRRPHLPRPRQGLAGDARRPRARSSARTSTSARPSRGWDFVSPGHGDVDFEALFRALNRIGYDGPAVDRVGGLGHGPRVGRGRRASLRAPDRLLALVGRLRRRVPGSPK